MRHTIIVQIVAILLLIQCNPPEHKKKCDCTVIIGAFTDEIQYLEKQMSDPKEVFVEGLRFVQGTLHGKPVIVGISGIGKVNASMTSALAIHYFHPKQIIYTGIAGGLNPDAQPGDLILGWQTVQHDLKFIGKDTTMPYITQNPINDLPNPVYYFGDSMLFEVALKASGKVDFLSIPDSDGVRKPRVFAGIIASGDAFIASNKKKEELILRFGADAVEMEGAAVAQVCYQLGIPCLIVRSISDSADDNAKATLEQFYKIAAENSANLVMRIVAEL